MSVYRLVFALAALCNLAFGLWVGLFPRHVFGLFALAPPREPMLWSCLGALVGGYCLAYLYIARNPDRGWWLAGIGLLAKSLTSLGWLVAAGTADLPLGTFPLILFNDLIWWFPFLCYLLHDRPHARRDVACVTVAVHLIACLALLVVQGGTETQPLLRDRAAWIAAHPVRWAAAWCCWVLSSLSLLALVSVWCARLRELAAPAAVVWGAWAVVAIGVCFDLAGEWNNIARLTRLAAGDLETFREAVRFYTLVGPAIANGLYCVAGIALSALSWRSGLLAGWRGAMGFTMWSMGLALTAWALLDHRMGQVISGGLTMVLFCPWALLLGWRLGAR